MTPTLEGGRWTGFTTGRGHITEGLAVLAWLQVHLQMCLLGQQRGDASTGAGPSGFPFGVSSFRVPMCGIAKTVHLGRGADETQGDWRSTDTAHNDMTMLCRMCELLTVVAQSLGVDVHE